MLQSQLINSRLNKAIFVFCQEMLQFKDFFSLFCISAQVTENNEPFIFNVKKVFYQLNWV